jgi:uncharacterized phage protein (TIGR02220 family)
VDWENERYVRLYVRETIDEAVLSWQAKSLWKELLPKFDRAGVIDLGVHGWKGLAVLIRWPLAVLESAVPELLSDGRIELRGRWLVAPNYIAAQEAKKSDRQRQAESRARRRDKALARDVIPEEAEEDSEEDEPGSVTIRDSGEPSVTEEVENVTLGHTPSHRVTLCSAVPCSAVQEKECGASPTPPPDAEEDSDLNRRRGARRRARDLAEAGIARLNELTGRSYQPTAKDTLDNLATLARDGVTEAQVIAVVDAKHREWKSDAEMRKYLRPSTLFRPTKFRAYLGDLVGAARSAEGERGGDIVLPQEWIDYARKYGE